MTARRKPNPKRVSRLPKRRATEAKKGEFVGVIRGIYAAWLAVGPPWVRL